MPAEMESVPLWQHGDDDLLGAIREAEQQRRAADSRMLALLSEAENRGLATAKGYGSTRQFLCDLLTVPRGEANRRIAAALATRGTRGVRAAVAFRALTQHRRGRGPTAVRRENR